MFGIGGFELFLILIFGFIIFGPDKLPEIAKTIGKAVAKFRGAQESMTEQLKDVSFVDKASDAPLKNPLDVLNNASEKAKTGASKISAEVKGAKASAESTSATTSTAKTDAASNSKTGDVERSDSFAERKARYDRERAERKRAEAEAEKQAEAKAAKEDAAKKEASENPKIKVAPKSVKEEGE